MRMKMISICNIFRRKLHDFTFGNRYNIMQMVETSMWHRDADFLGQALVPCYYAFFKIVCYVVAH